MESPVWVAAFTCDISTSMKMFIHQSTSQTGMSLQTRLKTFTTLHLVRHMMHEGQKRDSCQNSPSTVNTSA